jgi:hypothetical protein
VLKHRALSGVLYDAALAAHVFNVGSFLFSPLPIGLRGAVPGYQLSYGSARVPGNKYTAKMQQIRGADSRSGQYDLLLIFA